jgi:dTDP-4-amino-4,6-dideoxygalactose transaminase
MTDYHHIETHGRNSRLDELQAAVLRVKLPHLEAMNQRRRQIAKRYLRDLPDRLFVFQKIPDNVVSNQHVFVCRFLGDRSRFMAFCDEHGLQTNIYYLLPLHLQQANAHLGMKPGALPVVEQLCNEVVALPMYPELPSEILDRILEIVNQYSE